MFLLQRAEQKRNLKIKQTEIRAEKVERARQIYQEKIQSLELLDYIQQK